jgi:UPF0755 protein
VQSSWIVKQPFGPWFKFFVALFIILVAVVGTTAAWVDWALQAPSKEGKEKTFVIKEGETAPTFITRLKEEGIIKNTLAFRINLKLTGLDRKIQAGSFHLPTNKTASEIALMLTTGRLDKWVTFVEGLRKEEVAEKLAKNFDIDKEKFLAAAPEGYLFPDKYLITVKADEEEILSIFKTNFEKKFTKEMEDKAAGQNLSTKEVVTVASIVERESRGKGENERAIIAGILLKRWREGWKIAADATIQYALGYSEEEKVWWRKIITEEDLNIDGSYNTRKKAGLPPGPICSPGLSSIQAVINPVETEYYYYIHDKDGNPYYARTLAEHQANIQKYLSD